jgi:hypothetical protein
MPRKLTNTFEKDRWRENTQPKARTSCYAKGAQHVVCTRQFGDRMQHRSVIFYVGLHFDIGFASQIGAIGMGFRTTLIRPSTAFKSSGGAWKKILGQDTLIGITFFVLNRSTSLDVSHYSDCYVPMAVAVFEIEERIR